MSTASDQYAQIQAQIQALATADLATLQALAAVVADPTSTLADAQTAFATCLAALGDAGRIADVQVIHDAALAAARAQVSTALSPLLDQTRIAAGG